MARYTGPKTKIARKFGQTIFGDDKSSKRKNTLQGCMAQTKEEGKNLNMQFS